MTIIIIDKYPVLRIGLIRFLRQYFQQLTVFDMDNFTALHPGFPKEDIDLIILGIGRADGGTSIALIKNVKKQFPLAKLIAYDENPRPELVAQYFSAGLQGYVSTHEDLQKLVDCIGQVMRDQKYISEGIVTMTLDLYVRNSPRQTSIPLSPRESQVATLLCEGLSTSAIAETLERKVSTISTIKFHIFQKMEVDNVIKLREHLMLGNLKRRI